MYKRRVGNIINPIRITLDLLNSSGRKPIAVPNNKTGIAKKPETYTQSKIKKTKMKMFILFKDILLKKQIMSFKKMFKSKTVKETEIITVTINKKSSCFCKIKLLESKIAK